jgi:hypothetical protein
MYDPTEVSLLPVERDHFPVGSSRTTNSSSKFVIEVMSSIQVHIVRSIVPIVVVFVYQPINMPLTLESDALGDA